MKAIYTGLLVALLTAACEGVLDVPSPSRIPAEDLEAPANAQLLVNGAIADFDCAFGAYVVLGGLVGEELIDALQTADRFPYDRRTHQGSDRRYSVFGCEALGVYTPLQTARASAENVLRLLQEWTDAEVPNRTSLIATASAYSGYGLLLLGEGFCSAAVSTINPDRTITYGGEITRDSLFALAELRLTDAIGAAQAASNTDIERMSLVGRARARLNLGRFAQANADAALVPDGYVHDMTASNINGRRENRVWAQNAVANFATSVGEPYRSYSTAGDPRVPLVQTTRVSVTGVEHWYQTKYLSGASIRIASAIEARLIYTEGLIAAGQLAEAVDSLNVFRARGNQAPFVSVDSATIHAELVDQRRRELFLTGHHLGDIIRYGITLSPAAGTPYHGSGEYGSQVCFPLPDIERNNNPNIP
ncbi:MAG: RagB/SusD family nutrient uptake outer membrane protein [Gemmatimonadales bacterium]